MIIQEITLFNWQPYRGNPVSSDPLPQKVDFKSNADGNFSAFIYGEKLFDILGLRVETLENGDPENLDYINGVKIIEVKKDSPASDNNINRGDIITEMGKTSIKEKNEYDLELVRRIMND